jgi:hypothetical protein
VRLAARSTMRIHTGISRDFRPHLYQDHRNYVWDNKKETAILKDHRGHRIDTKSWNRH